MKRNPYRNRSGKAASPFYIICLLAVIVQGILSCVAAALVLSHALLPPLFILIMAGVLVFFFILDLLLVMKRRYVLKITGFLISLIMILLLIFALFYLIRVTTTLSNVSDKNTQTSQIVVAVRAEDPAESLSDTAGYKYGIPVYGTQPEIKATMQEIRSTLQRVMDTTDYNRPVEEAQALIDGDIDAAVYNNAYADIFDESIDGYSENIKIIYEYSYDSTVVTEGTDVNNSFNIYISGIDVSGPITTNSRSDVNIIMTVNPDTHTILLTTTPRDYYVTIPGISGDMRDKLTHAGIYGISASMDTLENLYGITLNDYIRINFTSLVSLVDALGGVDVNSDYTFSTEHYSFSRGINHLDGEQALEFSRERHSFVDGDNQRGKNQQAVLEAIINKLQSREVLAHASDILDVADECMQTSLTDRDITTMLRKQIADNALWTVLKQAAVGTGDSQPTYSGGEGEYRYVMWPDDDSVYQLSTNIENVMNGKDFIDYSGSSDTGTTSSDTAYTGSAGSDIE